MYALNSAIRMVKLCCGVANNAAWMACLEAYDHITAHPAFNVQQKGGVTPRKEFRRCLNGFHAYERRLLWNPENPFFHVADLTPESRKSFGKITDRDYYDLWAAAGAYAYQQTRPFFTSLVNKVRLAFTAHGLENPDILAWASTGGITLNLAEHVYNSAIHACPRLCPEARIPERTFDKALHDFSLAPVAKLWREAMNTLAPTEEIELTETEEKNIKAGIDQLEKKWTDADTLFGSNIQTAEDYAELFRTNGEMKKTMSEFAKMRDELVMETKK